MAEWKDILSEEEDQLSDEDLLKYFDERTSTEEKNVIERKVGQSSFDSDALQGLSHVKNKASLLKQVNQLNRKLHQQLDAKKQRKEKRKINVYQWIILTILILLFICIVGFVIIRMQGSGGHAELLMLPKGSLSCCLL